MNARPMHLVTREMAAVRDVTPELRALARRVWETERAKDRAASISTAGAYADACDRWCQALEALQAFCAAMTGEQFDGMENKVLSSMASRVGAMTHAVRGRVRARGDARTQFLFDMGLGVVLLDTTKTLVDYARLIDASEGM